MAQDEAQPRDGMERGQALDEQRALLHYSGCHSAPVADAPAPSWLLGRPGLKCPSPK